MRQHCLLGMLAILPTALAAQDARIKQVQTAVETIRTEDLMRDVTYLASDALKGRYTGSVGFDTAAAYVVARLKALGVKPMGDNGTYLQHYTVTRSTLDTTKASATIGAQQLKWGDDFIINNYLVGGVRESNVIYVGDGVKIPARGVNPYAGHDIKGKWVLVNAPLTAGRGGRNALGVIGVDYTTVTEEARYGGALGIIHVPTEAMINGWNRRATTGRDLNPSVGVGYSQYPVPRVILSAAALRKLVAGTSLDADLLLKADSSSKLPGSTDLGRSKRFKVDFASIVEDTRLYNVVGMIEGSDPVLKDQWLTLASHLDGAVGRGATATGDSIFNAADDNGSGSAGNLAIAQAFLKGPKPKRSVLMVWDSGEEVGLWGTRHLAFSPYGDKLVAHINLDMIGRTANTPTEAKNGNGELSGPGEVWVIGPKVFSSVMDSVVNHVGREYNYIKMDRHLDDAADPSFYPRTDSAPYAERGIPFIDIQTGQHMDYHRQTDEVSKLDSAKMTAVTKTVYLITWHLAESAATPRFDRAVPPSLWFVKPRK